MPTVPYNPVPEAAPSGQGSPYFNDKGATEQAFGAGIGQSMQQFANQLERTGSMLEANVLSAQRLKNEADVNVATTADIMTSGELNNKFRLLTGSQAQEGLDAHVQALKEGREKIRATLTNPEARRLYDQQTMHRLGLDVVNSSQHAATQMRQYTKQSYVDKSDQIMEDMSRNAIGANDPEVFTRGVKELVRIEREKGKLEGSNPDEVNKNIRTALTKATSKITNALSKDRPQDAQQVLDFAKKRGVIDSAEVPAIQERIDMNGIQKNALMDAAKIAADNINADPTTFARNPEGTLIKMRSDAEIKANELYPNDPAKPENQRLRELYLNQMNTNLQVKVNQESKAQNDRLADLKALSITATDKVVPATGRKPSSVQELNMVDPKAQDYITEAAKRDPTFMSVINNKFKSNASADKIIPQPQLDAQWLIWKGKSDTLKMQTDTAKLFNDGVINHDLENKMNLDKEKLKKQSLSNFNVRGIMSQFQSTLNDKGIFASSTNAEANTRFMWFQGALQQEIELIQGKTGVQVQIQTQQAQEIVNKLLKEETASKGWIWDTKKPVYEIMRGSEMPSYVKDNYPTAIKNPTSGKWQIVKDGKLYNVEPE